MAKWYETCIGWLVADVYLCERDIDKRGADWKGAMAIGLLNILGTHSALVFVDNQGAIYTGLTLGGQESAGAEPKTEFDYSLQTQCARCARTDKPLKFGRGKGVSGYDATTEQFEDCIRSVRARCDYNVATYNCNDWRREASDQCGLICPLRPRNSI